jgi:hypothetical protein
MLFPLGSGDYKEIHRMRQARLKAGALLNLLKSEEKVDFKT